jgi:hypothetical protein
VIAASPDGLGHSFVFNVPSDPLNEDDGPFDYDDELYAQATFVDADGGRRPQTTNVITGQF